MDIRCALVGLNSENPVSCNNETESPSHETGERERMRANVFKPSHILPTMTVEQFGQLEAAAARERATQQEAQRTTEMQRKAELASDDDDEDDRVKHKVRAGSIMDFNVRAVSVC